MQELINTIFGFFYNLYDKIFTYFYENNAYSLASNFLTKKAIDGELISIGATWEELIRIILPLLITCLLILLVFKVIWKMLFGRLRK